MIISYLSDNTESTGNYIYCHTHTNTFCEEGAEFVYINAGDEWCSQCALSILEMKRDVDWVVTRGALSSAL